MIVFPFLKVNLQDLEFNNRRFKISRAYYQSKLAQVMYTYWLSDQLKETKITINAIRVTNVQIDTSRYPNVLDFMKSIYKIKSSFSITPEEMAKTYTYLALSDDVNNITGKHFDNPQKQVKSSKYSMNSDNIDKVMNLTMSYYK